MSFFERLMTALKEGKGRRLLILPPILFAVLVVILLGMLRQPPNMVEIEESVTTARYVTVEQATIIPRAIGYGFARPEKVWNAVAQVRGHVVFRHPQLRVGASLPAGTEILRIDATDYELAVQRLEASVAASEARLNELETRAENTQASLTIEERSLVLKEQDLERKKTLLKRGAISQAAVDQEERAVLAQSQAVQSLRNQINLIPAQRQASKADLALAKAQLNQARVDLSRTSIKLPFDGRIAVVNVEESQVVSVGQTIAVADSMAKAEVDAQIPLDKLVEILPPNLSQEERSRVLLPNKDNAAETLRQTGLHAIVRLQTGNFSAQWPARVVRFTDQVDPQTRTVGVVVAIDEPYGAGEAANQPPLTKNMYVEVEVRGRPQEDRLLVPRNALHQGSLYILDDDNRLLIRKAQSAYVQGDIAVLAKGAETGERVIISDLIPAIPGMKIEGVFDKALAESTLAQAKGTEHVK